MHLLIFILVAASKANPDKDKDNSVNGRIISPIKKYLLLMLKIKLLAIRESELNNDDAVAGSVAAAIAVIEALGETIATPKNMMLAGNNKLNKLMVLMENKKPIISAAKIIMPRPTVKLLVAL